MYVLEKEGSIPAYEVKKEPNPAFLVIQDRKAVPLPYNK